MKSPIKKLLAGAAMALGTLRACSQITYTFGSPTVGTLRRCKTLV